ncbi:MAG: thymidylate kinase [Candidatus Diapherotrites archaeon]
MERGKIILIEGTDSSGKATQTELLLNKFEEKGIPCKTISFPDYNTPTGRIIGQCYLGKKDLGQELGWEGDYSWLGNADKADPKVISLFYAADRKAAVSKIEKTVNSGEHLIIDRWVESNMGHQGGKAKTLEEREEIINYIESLEYDLLKLPKPDLTIFLYMPTEVAFELRKKRDGGNKNLDGHETNLNHLKNAEEAYLQLANLYNWTKIDCVENGKIRSRQNIAEEVYFVVKNLFKIKS